MKEILAPNKYDDFMPSDSVERNPNMYRNNEEDAPLIEKLHIRSKYDYGYYS
eukprot:CAMPEP_0197018748 /NCGR_PEP_ID=MMETSP1380-20130617/80284_1 /TAXON_ID=5936 /ORGANISM="Euplotes crassus, Strain CT5" /LENGTH=51 /DNA_ID=CAMNT_0042446023 /DNA_START=726 /DNA_END=877 /DNA_ORIENTATION=+